MSFGFIAQDLSQENNIVSEKESHIQTLFWKNAALSFTHLAFKHPFLSK